MQKGKEKAEKRKKEGREIGEYTKYEIARILGARALQLSMNAPRLLKIEKSKLEEIKYDPLKIAELEFKAGVLPITVKRPMPKRVGEEKEEEAEVEEEKEEEKEREEVPEALETKASKEVEEVEEEEGAGGESGKGKTEGVIEEEIEEVEEMG